MTMHTETSTRRSGSDAAVQVVRGFCMGAADIVPGVSGGTVALLFGIYERLIDNVRVGARSLGRLARGDLGGFVAQLRTIEWLFLLPLLLGIGAAIASLSHLIETLLHDHPEEMAGLFFGLVVASIVLAWEMVRRWTAVEYLVLGGVSVASFFLLGIQSGPVDDPSPLIFLGAGAIAICAMILPGISGSFLLLMMGMYTPVLAAVNDRHIVELGSFGVGAVVGLAAFSTLLAWLLEHHSDRLIAALIGLLLGSLRVLWPWPDGVGVISDIESEQVSGTALGMPEGAASFVWPTVFAVLAFGAVVAVSTIAERRPHRVD